MPCFPPSGVATRSKSAPGGCVPNDRIALLAITRHGIALAGRVAESLPGATFFAPEKFRAEAEAAAPGAALCYSGKTGDQVPGLFAAFDALVAVVSLGAVVRLIAPHLGSKESDPAVVVLDEAGRFVIPALSGHQGGANALAGFLAEVLGAIPVITTASDARQTLAVDLLGSELGWVLEADHDAVVRAAAAVVNDEPVALVREAGEPDWWSGHANGRTGPVPANIHCFDRLEAIDPEPFAAVLWISRREIPISSLPALAGKTLIYRPPLDLLKVAERSFAPSPIGRGLGRGNDQGRDDSTRPMIVKVAVGLGCDRGTPAATIAQALAEALAAAGLEATQVERLASIDLKADEAGLLEFAACLGREIQFYPPERLAAVPVPNPSETVRRHTGTPSVSEAAALLAGGGALLLEKHRLRGPDGRNATVSIARISEW
ncbi:MAG: cobalamin biosynthesis protein [Gammaproteobacteria bacterium]|nr:cobalamin biosynthesis protein [Gammaproteobacteria bacterium]MBU1656150.1 cobalamin biosynthesis protein [Gammaproteobacteria bacterium]MBU1960794.1 cobalamin biosynthesis protein [Gammaproteobacteria bacterium]